MKVGEFIELLRSYIGDDELGIQIFEICSGEQIDSTSSNGIVAEDVLAPTSVIDIEAEKLS